MTEESAGARGPLRVIAWTAACLGLALGCGSGDGGMAPDARGVSTTLELPVRVHPLSSRLASLDARLSDPEVAVLMARVNEIWSEADIVWEVESIVREPAAGEDLFETALQGLIPLTADVVASVVPRVRRLAGGWDAYLVRDLASAIGTPGIYFPGIPAAVASVVDPAGLADPGRILAHELGHSLGLPHVPCTAAGNLMAPGCPSQDRTRLTADQISRARSQAASGGPAR